MSSSWDGRKRTDADGVLVRAFRVLTCFSEEFPELTALQIAERTALAPSTVHRLLARLIDLQAIVRTSDHTYALGVAVWALGELSHVVRMRERAVPHLARLHEATGETVHLALLDAPTPEEATAQLVARVVGTRSTRTMVRPGGRYSLHASALGKALLSTRTVEWLENYLEKPLEALTARSIATPVGLRAELARVRSRRFATTVDEMRLGVSSIAATVNLPVGVPPAAVGIVLATRHLDERTLAPLVVNVARELGHELTQDARSGSPGRGVIPSAFSTVARARNRVIELP